MKGNGTLLLTITWLVISTLALWVGIAYAGGISNIFLMPKDADIITILFWALSWIFVVSPFLLVIVQPFRRVLKKK